MASDSGEDTGIDVYKRQAFVRDKYRFNQWGRVKISQALRMKKIPADVIAEGLEEIDEREYVELSLIHIC